MNERPLFVPECWVDTALMRALLPNHRELINHQQGIGNVGRVMKAQAESSEHSRRFVVGMVDRDKKFEQQPYLRVFQPPNRTHHTLSTHHILVHPLHPTQWLIVLNPACDAWVLEAARTAGINPADYGIPTALKEFKDFCKQQGVTEIPELQELLTAIRQANPASYQELSDFVTSVCDHATSL